MTETTTAPGAATATEVDVRIEDDATPLVRLIGRTLRDSVRAGHALPALRKTAATVAIRSHETPQAATIAFAGGVIEVSSGVLVEPDASITVDLNARFAPADAPSGDAELASDALLALSPPVPDWQTAAEHFWTAARSVPGIPDVLIAVTEGPDGLEQVVLGEGTTHYLIAGAPETLAGVFSGADDLIAVLSTGALGIQGTLSQLSVMAGASWKVRYDV
ncbi:hypothetical protein DEJ44_31925 [Streptomyces venezuelae]|uniref:hypothetical protein n=1 Tax=Streptomyces venezuelae TaxID=54571 RepID=UPI00123C45F8|nr:hypothetical protein [Streptomyces venezuelae]QES09788.1 hypothetical protein DEJ44_31925 [Streptomyces venezuelae]